MHSRCHKVSVHVDISMSKIQKRTNNLARLDVRDTSLTGITNSACSAYIPDAFHLWIHNEVSRKAELDVWKPFVPREERFSLIEAHDISSRCLSTVPPSFSPRSWRTRCGFVISAIAEFTRFCAVLANIAREILGAFYSSTMSFEKNGCADNIFADSSFNTYI